MVLEDIPFEHSLHKALTEFFLLQPGISLQQVNQMGGPEIGDPRALIRSEDGHQESAGELKRLKDRLQKLDSRLGLEEGVADEHGNIRADYFEAPDRLRCLDYNDDLAKMHDEEGRAGRLLVWLVTSPTRGKPITQLLDS
ncbi:hypothetical protein NDU88_007161 [Pleurodeles waltl]|uniref:Uncharacterized protein n=1 Tax=Pleurodeles waltl TaxID=8319 RepID=A0AAV7QQT0_PLEWA|nr:hypothetical protein NDU88_007161 [Pleurodeles waltl]